MPPSPVKGPRKLMGSIRADGRGRAGLSASRNDALIVCVANRDVRHTPQGAPSVFAPVRRWFTERVAFGWRPQPRRDPGAAASVRCPATIARGEAVKFSQGLWRAATSVAFTASLAAPIAAQQVADPGFKSVGRGAPLAAALPAVTLPLGPRAASADPAQIQRTTEALNRFPFVGPFAFGPVRVVAASDGAVPAGV